VLLLLLLLLAQIVLLGVCISPSPAGGDQYEQLSLQPMPLYSLPSDNVVMTCVASSAGGRLFMGGSDGNLYEIQYEATDTWRRRRCSKVCVWGWGAGAVVAKGSVRTA
jgi:nuclear pore complex protein Nup155